MKGDTSDGVPNILSPDNTFTDGLRQRPLGKNKIAKKLGEESTELLIDYLNGSKKRTLEEASDLIYHLFVLLYSKKISLNDIKKELTNRHHVR